MHCGPRGPLAAVGQEGLRTWPMIWHSPRARLSRPEATRIRCSMASTPLRAKTWGRRSRSRHPGLRRQEALQGRRSRGALRAQA